MTTYFYSSAFQILNGLNKMIYIYTQILTRSGSVLTGLIPPAATNSSLPKVGQSQGQGH